MVGREDSRPYESLPHADEWVGAGVAVGSLSLLILGLVGLATSNSMLSATGLFLFSLVGFGSATLIALGGTGWNVLTLAAPLSVALVLSVGVLLATTSLWKIGEVLFWVIAFLSTCVHIWAMVRARDNFRATPVNVRGGGSSRRGHRRSTVSLSVDTRSSQPLALVVGVLSVIGFAICLVSDLAVRHLDPGWGGLLGAISPAWYVGLALLIVAIVMGQRCSSFFAGLPVVALQLVITGSSAIAFDAPRYAWTVKQLGVTSYILLHGAANSHIDIYQAWPGLFAGVAWLLKVSHLAAPIGIARWWPPVIDLATLLVVYQLASRVLRDPRRAWLAATLFVVGYTINDSDYFSPQSAAYLMTIAVFAVIFRHRDETTSMSRTDWVILVALSLAGAVTHQLSPYMVMIALVILVLAKRARTDWAPVITLTPAAVWALLHFSYVRSNVSLTGFLHIFSNVLTPGVSGGGPAPGQLANVVRYFQGISPLLLGFIALAALVRYRTNLHVVLALCAASGGALVLANSYGNEAAFRVVLFALPWLVILASTLQPVSRFFSVAFWTVALFSLLSTYLVADMGLDFVYAVRPGDLTAMQNFETNAPAGSTLIIIGYYAADPLLLTGNYNLINEESYSNIRGFTRSSANNAVVSYGQFMSRMGLTHGAIPSQAAKTAPSYYVLTGREPAAGLAAYNYGSLKQYQAFAAQIAHSSLWQIVASTSTAQLYRLRAQH